MVSGNFGDFFSRGGSRDNRKGFSSPSPTVTGTSVIEFKSSKNKPGVKFSIMEAGAQENPFLAKAKKTVEDLHAKKAGEQNSSKNLKKVNEDLVAFLMGLNYSEETMFLLAFERIQEQLTQGKPSLISAVEANLAFKLGPRTTSYINNLAIVTANDKGDSLEECGYKLVKLANKFNKEKPLVELKKVLSEEAYMKGFQEDSDQTNNDREKG